MKRIKLKLMLAFLAIAMMTMSTVGCKIVETTSGDIHTEKSTKTVLGKWYSCKICNGKGRCKTCKGTGKQKEMNCIECGGSGACPTCNGEGGYREIIEK